MDESHNPKFFDCGALLASCEFSHPVSDRDTDRVYDVLVSTDQLTGTSEVIPTFANPITATGQQFAEWEQARYSLAKLAKCQAATLQFTLHQFYLGLQELRKDLGRFAYLRELRKKIVEQFNAYLHTLFALRRVTRCLSSIKKIFFIEFRPFRGFDWSKRAWSLLHGSHPPKASAQTVVLGCA